MGLFSSKGTCAVCGGNAGATGLKFPDGGVICQKCFAKRSVLATSIMLKSTPEVVAHIRGREENAARYKDFHPTDACGDYIKIDRNSRTWCCPILDKKNPDIFSFDDLIDYELLEDGVSVTKGGLGSAVVGGALFGGVGAIVGGGLGKKQKDVCSKMSVKVNLRDSFISDLEIKLITADTKKGGMVYKLAKGNGEKVVSLLAVIADSQKPAQGQPAQAPSAMDELLKLKQLLDMGAITQEEYDAKKKQLLAL